MKKMIYILTIFMMMLTGCSSYSDEQRIADILSVQVSEITLVDKVDTMGWFNDGTLYLEYDCRQSDLSEIIKNNTHWKPLPLTDNLNMFLYDYHIDWDVSFPVVEKGYYYFEDRHSEATDKYNDSKIFDRNSYNIIIVIYDSENSKLYYCCENS